MKLILLIFTMLLLRSSAASDGLEIKLDQWLKNPSPTYKQIAIKGIKIVKLIEPCTAVALDKKEFAYSCQDAERGKALAKYNTIPLIYDFDLGSIIRDSKGNLIRLNSGREVFESVSGVCAALATQDEINKCYVNATIIAKHEMKRLLYKINQQKSDKNQRNAVKDINNLYVIWEKYRLSAEDLINKEQDSAQRHSGYGRFWYEFYVNFASQIEIALSKMKN